MYGNQGQTDEIKELRRQGGKWLKGLREAANLTQAELAERLGMGVYTFISQLENGRGRVPPDGYESWAQALGVPVTSFVHQILRYYDPITFRILFEADDQMPLIGLPERLRSLPVAHLSVEAPLPETEVEMEALRSEVNYLQRLLGKTTVELERLKERHPSSDKH
jgi:transcriptional regulator with XRE-family HTH domain